MDEIWFVLRIINFLILFVSFLILVYRGALKLTLDRAEFSWPRLMTLVWTFCACYSTGEILFLDDVPGGPRVVFMTIVSLTQLWVAIFKMPFYDVEEKPSDRHI